MARWKKKIQSIPRGRMLFMQTRYWRGMWKALHISIMKARITGEPQSVPQNGPWEMWIIHPKFPTYDEMHEYIMTLSKVIHEIRR